MSHFEGTIVLPGGKIRVRKKKSRGVVIGYGFPFPFCSRTALSEAFSWATSRKSGSRSIPLQRSALGKSGLNNESQEDKHAVHKEKSHVSVLTNGFRAFFSNVQGAVSPHQIITLTIYFSRPI